MQLARIGQPVLIQVAPHAQVGVPGIGAVEHAVSIGVQVAQGVEAVDGVLTIALEGVHTEQLAPGVDGAVAAAVPGQQRVVGQCPAGARADAVGVVVEQHHAVGRAQLQAVAVHVDDQRVAAGSEDDGAVPEVLDDGGHAR